MKKLLTLIGALALALTASAASLPKTGSFLSAAVISGSDTNLSVTNCLYVGPNVITNLVSATQTNINVSGSGAMAVLVDLIGDRGAGTTNNGNMTFVFGKSVDGSTFTTDTNGLAITVPVSGTRRVTWATNIAESTLGPIGYLRLQSIGHTNLGAYYVSNFQFRCIQTGY